VLSKERFGRGAWCVLGDFNAVLHRGERRGVNYIERVAPSVEVVEFGDFVSDLELVDLLILGRRFTWFHANGTTMSRIDRVLMFEEWLSSWPNPSLWVLLRTVSDHCPLVVRYNSVDWGPKPFG
jgi:endonuclease/exonuclease/phosphatase family metal-dependent hydrolase